MTTIPKLIIPSGVLPPANVTAFLYEPQSYVPMAEVVARVVPNNKPVMDIANLLLQIVPHCFLELAGRNLAKRASSQLKEFKAELADLSDRLFDLPGKAEAAISIAMLWNNQIACAMLDVAELPYGTLAPEIERLWIRLKRLHDVIPPDLDAAPSKPGRTAETHIDEFLKVLKTVWKQQTNSPPDIPRHYGHTEEFVGDFLDFAWAAIELAGKYPNSEKLRLPHSKNALGERLARKNRTKIPRRRGGIIPRV
jgi:hypothetical protein